MICVTNGIHTVTRYGKSHLHMWNRCNPNTLKPVTDVVLQDMISILLLLVIVCSSLQSTDVKLNMHFTDQINKSCHDFYMKRSYIFVSNSIKFSIDDPRITRKAQTLYRNVILRYRYVLKFHFSRFTKIVFLFLLMLFCRT